MNTGSALARFTITLSQAVTEPVQVEWFTSDGTAKAGVDYAANKGTVVFAPGETAKTVDILVYGRAVGSEDRSFFVEMLPPTNAILGASIGECIITVDTSGSTPVTAIIVPTGPKGEKGDPGEDGVSPDPAEIAIEVAPLIDVGSTVLTAQGTESQAHPDQTTVKAVARRVGYAAPAKIATVALADGDNTLSNSNLTGDAVVFTAPGFSPRVWRAGNFITLNWTVTLSGQLVIKSAIAGDVLYAVEYQMYSGLNSITEIDRQYEKATYNKLKSFQKGNTVNAGDTLLNEADGKYYEWKGAYPKVVPPNSTPASSGGVSGTAWVFVDDATFRARAAKPDGQKVIGLCASIAELRTIEPETNGQRIMLREYAVGTGKGGGWFHAALSSSLTDNSGTIIKTTGGAAWIRSDATVITPAMFGAIGDGVTDDTAAIMRVQSLGGVVVNFMGLTYYTTADLDFNSSTKSVFTNGTLKPSAAVLNTARVSNAGHIIDGLNIDGTLATGAIGYSVTITATGAQVRNLKISNTGRSAIACSAFESLIYRVWADGCGLLAVSPFVNTFYIIANEGTIVEECRLTRCYNGVYFRTDITASKTSRNKLLNTIMRGNGQTADTGAQGLSCQNNFGLEVAGCYISDFPDNGIDLQFSDYCHIHHNHVVNCKDGVFIGDRSCKGHNIHHNHFESCVRGFRFYCVSPELSASFFDILFTDNVIVSPSTVGIYVWLPNAVDSGQCILSRNTIRMLNSPAGASHAIQINNLFNSDADENKIVGCPQNGMVFTGGCNFINARGNSINNSSRGSTNTYDAVYIDNTTNRVLLRNTLCVGGGKAAVNVVGGAGHTVAGTRWAAMGTGGVVNNGSTTTLLDNVAI